MEATQRDLIFQLSGAVRKQFISWNGCGGHCFAGTDGNVDGSYQLVQGVLTSSQCDEVESFVRKMVSDNADKADIPEDKRYLLRVEFMNERELIEEYETQELF